MASMNLTRPPRSSYPLPSTHPIRCMLVLILILHTNRAQKLTKPPLTGEQEAKESYGKVNPLLQRLFQTLFVAPKPECDFSGTRTHTHSGTRSSSDRQLGARPARIPHEVLLDESTVFHHSGPESRRTCQDLTKTPRLCFLVLRIMYNKPRSLHNGLAH